MYVYWSTDPGIPLCCGVLPHWQLGRCVRVVIAWSQLMQTCLIFSMSGHVCTRELVWYTVSGGQGLASDCACAAICQWTPTADPAGDRRGRATVVTSPGELTIAFQFQSGPPACLCVGVS